MTAGMPAPVPPAAATRTDAVAASAAVVVIPAYNEASTIAALTLRVLTQPIGGLIVVDDGSTDAGAARLAGLPLRLLRHDRNRGKAAALCTGIEQALADGADAVITLDGDGQHRPEDIPVLLAAAREHPHAIIIAARLRRRDAVPRTRRFANWMADFWISWAAGYRIRDTQSGFRLYPATLLRGLRRCEEGRARGFVFESEVLIDAAQRGIYARAVVIDADYPSSARPSHYRPWRDTLAIVRMVALRLLARGMHPLGLLRALGFGTDPRTARR